MISHRLTLIHLHQSEEKFTDVGMSCCSLFLFLEFVVPVSVAPGFSAREVVDKFAGFSSY
jgi:hypothetical protein